jgi:subtilase family serine protease
VRGAIGIGSVLRRAGGAALVTAASLILASPASALDSQPRLLGAAPAVQQLQLILPLRAHDAALARFATAVSTPGSPDYGHYESIPALGRRFGAAAAERQNVAAYLRAYGATQVRVDATGMLAYATMSVPAAERLFAVPLRLFEGTNRSQFVAPSAAASIPTALKGQVEGVVGLDTQQVATTAPTATAAADTIHMPLGTSPPSSEMPLSGTPSGCSGGLHSGGFTPNQYLTAYGYEPLRARGLEGQGQKLALIEIDGLKDSDLRKFASCFGLSRPAWTRYMVGGLKHPLAPGGEATLDFEVADAVAPGLKKIEVFETANSDQGILAAISAPLFTPGAKPAVISNSIGLCEPAYREARDTSAIKAEDRELQLMAAAGISFVSAAGDNGSADCSVGSVSHPHRLSVDYPASSPWDTAVGGTNLKLASTNQIASQIVWNDAAKYPHTGGGGGYSMFHTRPSYQNAVVARNQRAVPDVSMLADVAPGYAIYCTARSIQCQSTGWNQIGGTSASAPLLAAGLVLVDQDLARSSRELVGFANPLLYRLGSSSQAASVFSDVTQYSNDVGTTFGDRTPLGCCAARVGFDEASGWGSVNLAGFDAAAQSLLPQVPKVTLSVPRNQRPVQAREVVGTVSCSRTCDIGALLEVAVEKGRTFQVTGHTFSLAAGQTQKVTLRFSHQQELSLKKALATKRQIFAEAFAYALNAQGNATVLTAGKQVPIKS